MSIENNFGNSGTLREATLTGVRGEYAGASIALRGGNPNVEIGSSAHLANLVFQKSTATISPRHATLMFDERRGLLICDQNSQYGIYVNGGRIPSGFWVHLNHGDTIEIGSSRNLFRLLLAFD